MVKKLNAKYMKCEKSIKYVMSGAWIPCGGEMENKGTIKQEISSKFCDVLATIYQCKECKDIKII